MPTTSGGVSIHIEGLEQLQHRTLKAAAVYAAALKPIMRKATNELRNAERARVQSKTVKRGVRVSTSSRGNQVRGKVSHGALAHLIEGGAKPHLIRPKHGRLLSSSGPNRQGKGRGDLGRGLRHPVREVRHPGFRARPFVAPAVAATRPKIEAMFEAAAAQLAAQIAR